MIKNNEIRFYKNLVEVNITDFNWKLETLYWEWTQKEFEYIYENKKSVRFSIHGWRVIDINRIMDFQNAKANDNTLERKISWLDSLDQENIKQYIKKYKSDFKKYPSEPRINNVIEIVLNPEKQKQIEAQEEIETRKIKDKKNKRINYFNWLEKIYQDEIIKKSRDKVFKINWKYRTDKDNIYAKTLFIIAKNEIIDSSIK